MQLSEVKAFIWKDVLLEWRQRATIGGVVLYLISTVFVAYLTFEGLADLRTWNALFWLILLFTAINAIQKSFMQENESRHLYYYTLISAHGVINAKMIYNALLMTVLGLAGLLVFLMFMGNPIASPGLFLVNMILGTIAFSSVLTLISAIASGSRNNFTLMAILGFPLVLPLLLVLIRVSGMALEGASFAAASPDLLVLILLICITFILSNLLFPYIWKE